MSLRDDIKSSPRGTQADLARTTGLCELTIIRAVAGTQCGSFAAKAIAAAFGAPDRWPELVVVKVPHRHHRPSPPEEAIPAAS